MNTGSNTRWRIPLSVQIMIGMAVGLLIGALLGTSAAPLGELGKLVIQLIKMAAAPLLFLAIVNAILKTDVDWRSGGRMVVIATMNATLALLLGLALSNLLQPGRALAVPLVHGGPNGPTPPKIELMKTLAGFVPQSFVQPFVDNAIIAIVLLALLGGFGLRQVRTNRAARGLGFSVVEDGAAALLEMMEIILGWIIRLVPVAVFGVVAKSVGEQGFTPFAGLGVYLAVGVGGLILHVLVTYQLWLVFYVGLPLRHFWREARRAAIYAFGTNSSLATLPVTLQALDRLGVSRASSTLGACVGTNLNNDGIILYEAMAVLFVAQAHGIDLSLGQQALASLMCLVAAMGIAGVPEAGFISLSVVLVTVGLPIDLLPLLLTVDWVMARARSVVNVLSDMLVSLMLERATGRRLEVAPTVESTPLGLRG